MNTFKLLLTTLIAFLALSAPILAFDPNDMDIHPKYKPGFIGSDAAIAACDPLYAIPLPYKPGFIGSDSANRIYRKKLLMKMCKDKADCNSNPSECVPSCDVPCATLCQSSCVAPCETVCPSPPTITLVQVQTVYVGQPAPYAGPPAPAPAPSEAAAVKTVLAFCDSSPSVCVTPCDVCTVVDYCGAATCPSLTSLAPVCVTSVVAPFLSPTCNAPVGATSCLSSLCPSPTCDPLSGSHDGDGQAVSSPTCDGATCPSPSCDPGPPVACTSSCEPSCDPPPAQCLEPDPSPCITLTQCINGQASCLSTAYHPAPYPMHRRKGYII